MSVYVRVCVSDGFCMRGLVFLIQHAMRMRRMIFSSEASLTLPYFSRYKRHDIRENVIEN